MMRRLSNGRPDWEFVALLAYTGIVMLWTIALVVLYLAYL